MSEPQAFTQSAQYRLDQRLQPRLQQHQQQNLLRSRRCVTGAHQPHMVVDGQPVLGFCSNDYLGLASDPQVQAASQGGGSGAAHLVCGHNDMHHRLERQLAEWTGREAALLFSTGYMANMGAIVALVGRGDRVFSDALNHASLIDGCRLSRADTQVFAHANTVDLQTKLSLSANDLNAGAHTLVITDGVFSMDGDLAPLAQQAQLCQQQHATLMVDEAHGLGVLGADGIGATEAAGLRPEQVPVYIGTLGKALGGFGGFVAGSHALIQALQQFARSYIYTTALPLGVVGALSTAVELCQQQHWRRQHLQALIEQFRAGALALGLPLLPSSTAIQPLMIGDSAKAMSLSTALLAKGIWVSAIRPPTVPVGTARLRITLSAAHSHEDVGQLLSVLAQIWQQEQSQ